MNTKTLAECRHMILQQLRFRLKLLSLRIQYRVLDQVKIPLAFIFPDIPCFNGVAALHHLHLTFCSNLLLSLFPF